MQPPAREHVDGLYDANTAVAADGDSVVDASMRILLEDIDPDERKRAAQALSMSLRGLTTRSRGDKAAIQPYFGRLREECNNGHIIESLHLFWNLMQVC